MAKMTTPEVGLWNKCEGCNKTKKYAVSCMKMPHVQESATSLMSSVVELRKPEEMSHVH